MSIDFIDFFDSITTLSNKRQIYKDSVTTSLHIHTF